jgi:hypothetical protein
MTIESPILRRLLVVLFAGALSVVCFSMVCLYRETCTEICTVIFVIILSVVSLVTCVIAGRQMKSSSLENKPACGASSPSIDLACLQRLPDISDNALCPVCLCALSDCSGVYQMDCCLNVMHRRCLTEYVDSNIRSVQISPPCMLCRKAFDTSSFRAKAV